MNGNTDASKKLMHHQQHARELNAECPSRWVIHCICCENPVEPWQTIGYQHGYCGECFDVLMAPMGKS